MFNNYQFGFSSSLRMNLARLLFLFSGGLFFALLHRPLLVTAAVPAKGRDGGQVYLSGLATVYTAWLLTALLVAPLIVIEILLGDAYVWPCLFLLISLFLPPLHRLHKPASTVSPKPAILQGEFHYSLCSCGTYFYD